MPSQLSDLGARIVRLNAELFPVDDFEAGLYRGHGLQVTQVEANTPAEIIPYVTDCDALFVVSAALPETVIASMGRCRVIARQGLGTEKIAVDAATAAGILVTNVPDFCFEEQADHAMALLLTLARQIPAMAQAMQEGAWIRARLLSHQNQRLSTQVLGLVGFGRSAQAMARRARGFGMRVLATRRRQAVYDPESAALGVEMVDMHQLLAESDFVSLHLPLTSQTRHLIDDAALERMKRGAYLINTARGAIVDELALVDALRSGRLAGAGLDTFELIDVHTPEERRPEHPLLELDNVVLTPHVAAGSVQAMEDVARGSVENVVAVLSGRWPLPERVVNPQVKPRRPLAPYSAG